MSPLRAERIAARLPADRQLARRIEVLESCASTADELRRRLAAGETTAGDGLLLVAEEQRGGRGRRQRDWWSGPAGANLAFSLSLAPPTDPPEAAGLLAACAVAAAVEATVDAEVALKWPNDLLIDGAKVAGLLAEAPSSSPACLLLGVGLNLAAAPPAEVAPYPTACLADFAAETPSREQLLADFLTGLEQRWLAYRAHGPAALEREFLARLRRWAPFGVRALPPAPAAAGPLLEFSVRRGLTWGKGQETTRPAGLLPALQPLPPPANPEPPRR